MTDPRQKAFERALKSISVRERTESEVKDFLVRRGYDALSHRYRKNN